MKFFHILISLLITSTVFSNPTLNNRIKEPQQKQGLPVIYFHGFGSSCHIDENGSAFKAMKNESPYKNPVYCVEYGALINGVLRSMNFLAKKACRELERNQGKFNLQGGFLIFGSSQGNMVARYIIQECSVGKYVKGYISSGGPHMGLIRWPHTDFEKYEKIINEITEDIVYTPEIQYAIAPGGYFKSIRRHKEYLEHCIFLPYMNNEKHFNQQYKDRMTSLKYLAAIKYLKDEVIYPNETEHFGYYADETETTMIKMEDTDEYKQDLFGIRTLNEAKKLTLIDCDASHVHPTYQWCLDNLLPWLNPDLVADKLD